MSTEKGGMIRCGDRTFERVHLLGEMIRCGDLLGLRVGGGGKARHRHHVGDHSPFEGIRFPVVLLEPPLEGFQMIPLAIEANRKVVKRFTTKVTGGFDDAPAASRTLFPGMREVRPARKEGLARFVLCRPLEGDRLAAPLDAASTVLFATLVRLFPTVRE